ncbi:MAG TPA: flagellar basal body P-ring formation chaperone FlgA [Vicinamibacterales bacterium]|nr:flagellar basal body P-ring formation chaperone FlgA [Vicinamibacterales bacterium]
MIRTALALALLLATLSPLGARAQAAAQRVSGADILRAAAQAVAALPHDADHAYAPASLVPDQLVDAGGPVDVRAGTPIGNPTFVDVPVSLEIDGRVERTVFVGYRVQTFVETAVAARDLAPGTVLGSGDLALARVPYAGRPGNSIDVLIGRKAEGTLLKGQPVTVSDTIVNQIVKAGSTVTLVVRDGGVALTADVIARTGGGLGEQVFVYNPSTRKSLTGTVTAPGTVELDISGGDQ